MSGFSIRTEGKDSATFSCETGESILRAALRKGLGFPYECNSGGCGSCQVQLVEGEVEERWSKAPGLSASARERGRRLACQCVAKSDCTIRVTIKPTKAPRIVPHAQRIRFTSTVRLTADMSEFVFVGDGAAEVLPGQFAMLELPGVDGARAYSMSNLPDAEGEWRFIVKRVRGGAATGWLFDTVKSGDVIQMDGPFGHSYLNTESPRDIVCVAGGSGLSPVMSILRAAVREPMFADRKITCFYGGRGPEDLCLPALLAADPKLPPRVDVRLAISDDDAPGASAWMGARGFVHELVRKDLSADMKAFEFYFCGPPAMTDALHRMLLIEHKVPSAQLHFDRFF